MGQADFNLSSSEDTIRASNYCARCGDTAEVHFALLGTMPQRSGSFCLPCGEALIHDLQHQYAALGHEVDTVYTPHTSFAYDASLHDDGEGGIIFWEGHGWSSDGPFAGA